ncbi:MAG: hypothetical protein PHQ91_10185 [Thermoanaerobaculaceae bacterium]|nr:hypothetical protein [Thermoanaerobaculaceae bacterium]
MHDAPQRRAVAPYVAGALALAYPAAVAAGPWALAGVTIAAAVSGCALVLVRRRSARLRAVLAAIAVWLAVGLAGALLLQPHAGGGFAWVLLVLYVIPLPLIPWLYARTFTRSEGAQPQDAPRSPIPARPRGRGGEG